MQGFVHDQPAARVIFGAGSFDQIAAEVRRLRARSPELPILVVPTTFAGSEMMPIYCLTEAREKKTGRDRRVLPKTVISDPELTLTLPTRIAGPSGMNAISHCVEGLYAPDGNPIISMFCAEGIRRDRMRFMVRGSRERRSGR